MELKGLINKVINARFDQSTLNDCFTFLSPVTGHQLSDFNKRFLELWCNRVEKKLPLLEKDHGQCSDMGAIVELCYKGMGLKCFALLLEKVMETMTGSRNAPSWEVLLRDIGSHLVTFCSREIGGDETSKVLHGVCEKIFLRFQDMFDSEISQMMARIMEKAGQDASSKSMMEDGRSQLMLRMCCSNEELCSIAWKKLRVLCQENGEHPSAMSFVGVFVDTIRPTPSTISSLYGKRLTAKLGRLTENPFGDSFCYWQNRYDAIIDYVKLLGLSLKSCGHCISTMMTGIAEGDLNDLDPGVYFWLPLEFPIWAVAAPFMCYMLEREFLKPALMLWKLMMSGGRTDETEKVETLIINLRCLSSKSRLALNDLSFALASLSLPGRRVSSESQSDARTEVRRMPFKRKRTREEDDEVRLPKGFWERTPIVGQSQPLVSLQPLPSESSTPLVTQWSELVEAALFFFVLSRPASSLLGIFDMVSELPHFGKEKRISFAERLQTTLGTIRRFSCKPSPEWTERIISNLQLLEKERMTNLTTDDSICSADKT